MNIELECIPCVVRQAVEAALEHISSLSFDTTPPQLGMDVHRIVEQALTSPVAIYIPSGRLRTRRGQRGGDCLRKGHRPPSWSRGRRHYPDEG